MNGTGKIGEFWFKVKTGIADNTALNMSIVNAKKANNTGNIAALSSGNAVVTVVNLITGLSSNALSNQAVTLFPNPAANHLTMQSANGAEISYTISDITGRSISAGTFSGAKTLDLAGLASGSYLVRFESVAGVSYKKFVIEK